MTIPVPAPQRISLWQMMREDLDAFCEGKSTLRNAFFIASFYPAFKAVCGYRIAHRLYACRLKYLAYIVTYFVRCVYGIDISPLARIGRRFRLVHGVGTVIGMDSVIGDNCEIYQGVTLGTGNARQGQLEYPTLGDNVTVYAGAKILGGVTVGEQSLIGANAVVVADVPAHAVAAGVPARVVRLDGHKVDVLERGDRLAELLTGILERLDAVETALHDRDDLPRVAGSGKDQTL